MRTKKKLVLVISLTIISILSGCTARQSSDKETTKRLENLRPISEVAESAYEDLQKAKEEGEQLTYDDIKPYCPKTDTIYDIKYYFSEYYKNITNEKDMLEEQLAITEALLGEKVEMLNMEGFETGYYNIMEHGNYTSFEEFLNDSLVNEKLEPSYLYYVEQDETKLKAIAVQSNFADLCFWKGRCYAASYEYRMSNDIPTLTQPRFVCDVIKSYYVYSDNDNLEDKWQLENGEISIQEGIDYVEGYLNNGLQLDGKNDEVELKVESVEVLRINKDYYCFRYRIRKDIGGVLMQAIDNGSSIGNVNMDYELSDAYQVEVNQLDMYSGPTGIIQFDKLNETGEILPLSDAIASIEENIGENSRYHVTGIELGYLSFLNNEQTEGLGTACWVFRCVNELDKSITEFYVNVQTGEIKTYSRHD